MAIELVHIGIPASSRARAERFFTQLLGLPLEREGTLPDDLASDLFDLESGGEILYFRSDGLVFEVFVTGRSEAGAGGVGHVCIEVPDRAELLDRARAMGYEVRDAPRRDYRVYFLRDEDGNRYEIKERWPRQSS